MLLQQVNLLSYLFPPFQCTANKFDNSSLLLRLPRPAHLHLPDLLHKDKSVPLYRPLPAGYYIRSDGRLLLPTCQWRRGARGAVTSG